MPMIIPNGDLKAQRRALLTDALEESASRRLQTRFWNQGRLAKTTDVGELLYGTAPDSTPIEEIATFEYDKSKPGGFLTQLDDQLKGRNVPVTPRISRYRIARALKHWKPWHVRIGGNNVRMTRKSMEHILSRHHPYFFYNGNVKVRNSQFGESLSPDSIQRLLVMGIRQNWGQIQRNGTAVQRSYPVRFGSGNYNLVIGEKGVVTTFHPVY